MIDVAEKDLKFLSEKSVVPKQSWDCGAIALQGVGRLCRQFGKSRQVFYKKKSYLMQQQAEGMLILNLVAAITREIHGLGTRKLHRLLGSCFVTSKDTDGEDKLLIQLAGTRLSMVFYRAWHQLENWQSSVYRENQLNLAQIYSLPKGYKIKFINQGDSDPQEFILKLISMYLGGQVPFEKLIKKYAFEDINQGVQDSAKGKTIKPVLLIGKYKN